MALSVGFVNDSGYIKPCGFHKPPCSRPGPFLELVFFIVEHLLVENSSISRQIEVVRMEEYIINGSQSILGSLVLNETDITPTCMMLSEERAKVLPYVFPMYQSGYLFVYRRVHARKPNLGLFTTSQWHVWAFAVIMGSIAILAKKAKSAWCARNWIWNKYMSRQNLIFTFFFGLFLK